MSRTTARSAAMQMIFEKVSGGQGGEETLKMVYDELRENGIPGKAQYSTLYNLTTGEVHVFTHGDNSKVETFELKMIGGE